MLYLLMSVPVVSRDIFVWRDKESLLSLKSRIESLFGVGLNFSYPTKILARGDGEQHPSQSEWIKVTGPSEDACLKTQKYVLAACKPDFTVVLPCSGHFSSVLFHKSPKLRDEIEREFQTFIFSSPEGIVVQGTQSAVSLTITRLQGLMDTLKQTQDSNPIGNISDKLTKLLLEDTLATNKLNCTKAKRIKQFVDLGYPQHKVENVIEALGLDATDNDIMGRLLAIHSVRETTRPTSITPPAPVPDKSIPHTTSNQKDGHLRPIVIDGSNIAISHGKGMVFSCKGIYLVVSFFQNRGHKDITVFVPQWRKEPSKPESPITDQEILFDLEKSNIISYTPSRRLRDKKIVCYDDRFIVRLATERGGVIVSNDHFKDLLDENEAWREVIENRLLMYTWVDDTFMVPSDPLGKHGPHLDVFLRFEGGKTPSTDSSSEHPIPRDKQPCPYKERCTFGPRCRYYHPGKEQKQPSSNGVQTSTSSRGGSPQSQSPSHNMRKEDLHSYQMSPTKQLGHLGVSGGGMYQYGNRLGSPLDIPGGLVAHQQQLPVDPYSSPYPSHHIRPPNTLARGMDRNFDMNCSPSPDLCPSFARVHGGMVPTVTPPPGQYYSPDQYIDHVRPTRRETAPLTQNTYINPSHPPRPHSALINTYPHTSNYYKHNQDSPHHQSIYEVAVRLFPSDQDRIQRILYQYPHINDLNVLIQYLTR